MEPCSDWLQAGVSQIPAAKPIYIEIGAGDTDPVVAGKIREKQESKQKRWCKLTPVPGDASGGVSAASREGAADATPKEC